MRNSRADRFLQSLGIETWSWRELDTALNSLFKPSYWGQGPRSESLEWLSKQDDVWMQEFYTLLADLIDQPSYRFRPSPGNWHVIRTKTGKHVLGSDAYFPDKQAAFDVSTLQIVNPLLLEGKDERRIEKVRQFLEEAGVQEVGEREKIKNILDMYYVKDAKPLDEEERLKHMAMFVSYVKSDGDVSIFGENKYFLFLDSGKNRRVPLRMCYLDTPFYDTGLAALYEAEKDQNKLKYSFWEEYREINGFVDFAKAIGVAYKLKG